MILLLFAVLVGSAVVWRLRPTPIDRDAVLQANSRGVGHMEQFDFPNAVEDFTEVTRLDPAWLPGQINLGIALLNTAEEPNLDHAHAVFEEVLQRDPDNPYAHYCLGVLLMYRQDSAPAVEHFEAVTHADPDDAGAWYFLSKVLPHGSEESLAALKKARDLDPHLGGALYSLAMDLRRDNPKEAQALLREHEALTQAGQDNVLAIKYGEMGHYADVIGTSPAASAPDGTLPRFALSTSFQVDLAAGARWARLDDLGWDPAGTVRTRVRQRFGATVAVLDYNGDGRSDLFLAAAVVDGGKVRDLLLRNEGQGRFVDATAEAGLAGPSTTLGCCVGDFDNDGRPDLVLTGSGQQRLLRNTGGRFEDVTKKAGLDKITGVCLGAALVDVDQDGDLDLVLAEFAANPADAVRQLDGGDAPTGRWRLFLNIGSAPPTAVGDARPALTCAFRQAADFGPPGPAAAVTLAASDIDNDRDVDLVLFADGKSPTVLRNDRLLRFCSQSLAPDRILPPGTWNAGLVMDAAHQGRSGLFLVGPHRPPLLLLPARGRGFHEGEIASPPLLQAVTTDLDLDGWPDVVGLSSERRLVALHNEGHGRLIQRDETLPTGQLPSDLLAMTVLDVDGDGYPDILCWSEESGLRLLANQGNGNHSVQLALSGFLKMDERGNKLRSNADAFGAWAAAQAGDCQAGQENTTLSAGLAQSRQPLLLGLGRHNRADVVRIRWPDGVQQAELDIAAGPVRIEETNRKTGSCPVLFAWDGQRFAFVTDFLGAGAVGEQGPDGGCRPPRPEESVKIEPGQLLPRDGSYVLKIAQPAMDEVTYLDRLQLVVLDHPAAVRVYPDERFPASDPPPTQKLFAFETVVLPEQARDHRGRDVAAALRAWDRVTVDGFRPRAWLGFAEEHFIELDFGERLSGLKPTDRLLLCLAGWTDYPFPESIWAAHQAGIAMQPPVLERFEKGAWRPLGLSGFPAGLPRMMTLDVTGLLGGPTCRLRLRTNLQVYWDQAFIAAHGHEVPVPSSGGLVRSATLEVQSAEFAAAGMMREKSPDGRQPTIYDAYRFESVPAVRLAGQLTRHGDVTELVRSADDRFVILGPDDVLTVRFDARGLPPLPQGRQRSFVLRTWGYGKDAGPFTLAGSTIEPLPFRTMRQYGDLSYPNDRLHRDYRQHFNTRQVPRAEKSRYQPAALE